jgi:putative methionine-R-sulfoxide reductase with GAF domain
VTDRELVVAQARAFFEGERDAIANAANLSALIFASFSDLNWAGFYFVRGEELVLGPFQGKTACVRIARGRGVCGTAWDKARDARRARRARVPGPHRLRLGLELRGRGTAGRRRAGGRRARRR